MYTQKASCWQPGLVAKVAAVFSPLQHGEIWKIIFHCEMGKGIEKAISLHYPPRTHRGPGEAPDHSCDLFRC